MGTLLRVKVFPGSRFSRVQRGTHADVHVHVPAAAEHGKATEAACLLMAEHFGCAPSLVRCLRGHTSRIKTISLPLSQVEVDEVMRNLL